MDTSREGTTMRTKLVAAAIIALGTTMTLTASAHATTAGSNR